MAYSDKVIDHYENPRNVGKLNAEDPDVGTGMVGAPACGDVMRLQIKVNESGVIEDAKFKTYGCGSAIASSSLATEWMKGKTLDEAETIKNTQLAEELALPPVKIHCSVLAEDAMLVGWNGSAGTATSAIEIDGQRDAGATVGEARVAGPLNTTTVPLELAAEINGPSPWWRLTHPLELLGLR